MWLVINFFSAAARVALETADVSGALLASSVFNLVPRARLTAQRYVFDMSMSAAKSEHMYKTSALSSGWLLY